MNLCDPHLELRFMKTILSGASHLFYQTDKTWFATSEIGEIWDRINTLNRNGKEIPSLYSLSEDFVLSDAARGFLKGDIPIFQSTEYSYAMDELDYYRKGRVLYKVLAESTAAISGNRPDMEDIRKKIQEGLVHLNRVNLDDNVLSLGRDNEKALEFYQKTMDQDVNESLIRTGFRVLDDQGGFSRNGVYVIAANSGGGKSTFANQISMNMALKFGESVGYVSLEMNKELVMYRAQSLLCSIDQTKFQKKTLTPEERLRSDKMFKDTLEHLKQRGSPLDYLCLGGLGFDIYKLLNFLEPLQHKVIVLDYANLLEPINKKEGLWWNLGEMIRLLKIYSERYNKCILFLAQTDEETGKIKYAQAITHHADGILTWKCTKKEKELGVVDIEQPKMRRADPTTFQLGLELQYSRFNENFNMVGTPQLQQKPETRMRFE